ncbi:transcription factor bHLH110 isoform X2 [Cryptomeria japonica]|uniref:transcription factor bHLH110 isoform X2 n=1 Tax=Cryptomeria japonica TaxID=3369 RepID=UPI0025AD68C5|nr:transcription factor bHLH110 isoform X2 [Cryptomeria japonica]
MEIKGKEEKFSALFKTTGVWVVSQLEAFICLSHEQSSGMPIYNIQGNTTSAEMKDLWANSTMSNEITWTTSPATNNSNSLKKLISSSPQAKNLSSNALQNASSFSSVNVQGKFIFPDTDSFACGSFTRLLDPSNTLDCAGSIDIAMDEFSANPVPLKLPTTFQSSNILTFHNNMNKLEMAGYPNPKPVTPTVQQQKPHGSPSDSSPSTSSSNNTVQKSAADEGGECTTEQKRTGDQAGLSNSTFKKPKTEASTSAPMKVRKEKLGERITALQQLVSPFGKTDTASVLLEAMGYIKFLQDQVQVLSTPYLKGVPSSSQNDGRGDQAKYDLRSRGLCLVPVSCTLHVANNNGADFWTSGLGSGSKF